MGQVNKFEVVIMSGKAVKTLPVWGHREFIESKNMDYTYGSPKYLWLSHLKKQGEGR